MRQHYILVIAASTLHCYWTLQLFVAGLAVGSAPVLFIGRGRHGRIRHQPDLTWVCWWRQVTEEEVHLCRAVAAGHNFFLALWGKAQGNIEVEVQEAGTVLLILGAMLGGGTFCSDTRRTPFPLLVADGLQWKGERGQTGCDNRRFSHRPRDGVILGLFCRARTD